MSIFGKYAHFYDFIYKDKDYQSECKLIKSLFVKYRLPVKAILDLGCGTGNHAFILHKMGYSVTGIDRSSVMLQIAHQKLKKLKIKSGLYFKKSDIKTLILKKKFDAAVMMFGVLSYQLGNGDVLRALSSTRKHLKKGSLFIFDVWYGPAVLHEKPGEKVKIVPTTNGQILRFAEGQLDILKHTCRVHYNAWQFSQKRVIGHVEETHEMRYFFPKELELFLETCHFRLIDIKSFTNPNKKPDETSWNALGVAEAID